MTDINLRSKDGFLTSRSVNTSNNYQDSNVFSNQSKKITGKNSLSKEDKLIFSNTIKNMSPSDPFSANNKVLASINRNENLSSFDFANGVMPPNILVESKGMTKNTSINNNIIQVNKKNIENNKLSRFDAQTVSLIKKFDDAPYAPYTKDYKCALNTAVITNTSEIKDYECSKLYEKTPFILAQDIFDLDAVKNDPELRTKISNFVSLLSTGDKAALAYTQNIFDRKPPLSIEKIKDVFDKLTSMMNTSYDPKVGKTKELVISALHDLSMPSDISQEGIGTCVGTSIQIQLAIRNPSEYLNMLDTLAQNKIYTSVTGANIPPNFTFTDEGIEKNLDTGRTISAKIMQNAIMDFSDMNTRDFNSAKGDGGLNYVQTVKGLKEIVNTNVETSYVWDYTPAQLINTLKNAKPDWNNPIEISMSYEPNGRDSIHSVNVVNISDNQVTIVNPWGREETFPNDELNKRILSISAPVNTDRGVIKVNVTDQVLKNKIADNNTKVDALKNISVEQKIEIVRNITSGWDGNKFSIKSDISQNDRMVVVNILDDLLKQGTAQNNVWLPRLKFFATDMADFLNKVQVNNDLFTKISNKLLTN